MANKDEISDYAGAILDEYRLLMGSKKVAISAGMVALSKLSVEEQREVCREAMVLEREKRQQDLPEHVQELIDTRCREIVRDELRKLNLYPQTDSAEPRKLPKGHSDDDLDGFDSELEASKGSKTKKASKRKKSK
jgi:hypothetical protein